MSHYGFFFSFRVFAFVSNTEERSRMVRRGGTQLEPCGSSPSHGRCRREIRHRRENVSHTAEHDIPSHLLHSCFHSGMEGLPSHSSHLPSPRPGQLCSGKHNRLSNPLQKCMLFWVVPRIPTRAFWVVHQNCLCFFCFFPSVRFHGLGWISGIYFHCFLGIKRQRG